MRPFLGAEPEVLTNTGKKQTYITGHPDTIEYNETNTTESGWKLTQYKHNTLIDRMICRKLRFINHTHTLKNNPM